uniref:venom protein 302-like n=1 Tax=Styela clava TaxID=7725 RepID=UPI00193A7EBB|nr:venom protein 302-like [Styela clava]
MLKILLLTLACCFIFADALRCSCRGVKCGSLRCGPRVGKVRISCGCCPVCAKQKGDECGGAWFHRGKCDTCLECVNKKCVQTKDDEDCNQEHQQIPEESTLFD